MSALFCCRYFRRHIITAMRRDAITMFDAAFDADYAYDVCFIAITLFDGLRVYADALLLMIFAISPSLCCYCLMFFLPIRMLLPPL